MPKLAFTDKWLKTVSPKGVQDEYTDALCANLRLRVTKFSKTFSVMIGETGHRKRITLGRYPGLGLKEARTAATTTASDPLAPSIARGEARLGTVKDLFNFVIASMEAEGKEADANRSYLLDGPHAAIHVFGADTIARTIRPADVTAWLRSIHNTGTKTKHPRAYLSAAFGRGIVADNDPSKDPGQILFGIESNPVEKVGGRGSSNPGDRVLSFDELRQVWREFPTTTSAGTGVLLRLLITMGGVRVTEVLRSEKTWWSMGEVSSINMPRTKNKRAHTLPLPKLATQQLHVAQNLSHPDSPYLFPHQKRPVEEPTTHNTLSQAVRRYCRNADIEAFQPRDIRRTMKTHLLDSDEDIREEWTDIWHNHGKNASVARKHYDRAEYRRVKQNVADAIDAILEIVLTG